MTTPHRTHSHEVQVFLRDANDPRLSSIVAVDIEDAALYSVQLARPVTVQNGGTIEPSVAIQRILASGYRCIGALAGNGRTEVSKSLQQITAQLAQYPSRSPEQIILSR